MTETDRLIRAARAAGRRADRTALVAAAKAWVVARTSEQAWWTGTARLGDGQMSPIEAGLILLAGQGRATHDSIARRLVFVDANPDDTDRVRLLAQVPPAELDNYSLLDLAWLRLIGSDWRPVPPTRTGHGRLTVTGRRSDRVARQVIEAFAASDHRAIADAIDAAAAFERTRSFSRTFSLFGFALAEEARRLGVDPGIAAYDFCQGFATNGRSRSQRSRGVRRWLRSTRPELARSAQSSRGRATSGTGRGWPSRPRR